MVDPVSLSLVGPMLSAVNLIRSKASTASQNESKCLQLAQRVSSLASILPGFASADQATARTLQNLNVALDQALRLIQSCQSGVGKYSSSKGAELDNADRRINSCIMELNLITSRNQARAAAAGFVPAQAPGHTFNRNQVRAVRAVAGRVPAQTHGNTTTRNNVRAAGSVPAQTRRVQVNGSCYQAQGGRGGTSRPQQAWRSSTPQGYYGQLQPQGSGYAQWGPRPPVPWASNLTSRCARPTVGDIIDEFVDLIP